MGVEYFCLDIETRNPHDNEGDNNNVIEGPVPTSHPKAYGAPAEGV